MFLCSMTQSLIYDFGFGFDFEFDFVFYFDFGLTSLPTSDQTNAVTLAHLSLHPDADVAALSHFTLHPGSVTRRYEGLHPNDFS